MEKVEKITFETEEGSVDFYVLDETRINNCNYILVADSMEDEAEALILKDVSDETDAEGIYEIVDDEVELAAVAGVFEESMGDISFE